MRKDGDVRMAEVVNLRDQLDLLASPAIANVLTVTDALEQLDHISETMARLGLERSEVAKRKALGELVFFLEAEDDMQALSDAYKEELSFGFGKLREVVQQEMEESSIFPVLAALPTQDFGVNQQLNPALPSEIYDHLAEAQRCWRMGFTLAALMVTFSATELITKYYYEGLLGHLPPARHTWGQVVGDLADGSFGCPRPMINALKRIIREYRNQVTHNGLKLDSGRAETIYGVCARVSRSMLDDVLKHGNVKQPPDEQEIRSIMMALDPVVGMVELPCFVHILCGEPLERICQAGWDRLPDYGVFKGLSLQTVSYKVEYCQQVGLLTYNERLLLCYSDDTSAKHITPAQYATELWIGRLMQWFNKWIEEETVSVNWNHLEKVSPRTKMAVLDLIADQGILELEPVLRAWSPYESDPIKGQIDRTLASFSVKEINA